VISFIVPAYNEELLLGRTLAALNEAGSALGEPFELVVADDASNDQREFWSKVARNYDRIVDLQIGPTTRSLVRDRVAKEDRLGTLAESAAAPGDQRPVAVVEYPARVPEGREGLTEDETWRSTSSTT
jgi:glycosyltransferase involved in cell wall biosynthesis